MPPSTLSYGLNLANRKPQNPATGQPSSTGQKRKKTIFDFDSEDENTGRGNDLSSASDSIEISSWGDVGGDTSFHEQTERPLPKKDHQTATRPSFQQRPSVTQSTNYVNLASLYNSKKHAEAAASLDPSVYDYDAVYDSLHIKPSKDAEMSLDTQGPKYMTALLRSAEVRKRDQLRARDRLLQREREAEGDEHADKEKFVTSAYKAQQEEIRRIEAEEAEREKQEEERRKKGIGMVGFYKDILARDDKRHEEAVKAAEDATSRKGAVALEATVDEAGDKTEKSEAQVATELNARGANVVLNDEGQIVDKRQLLAAGLNVASRKKPQREASPVRSNKRPIGEESYDRDRRTQNTRTMQRARQTEMLAAQFEERVRKEQEEEEVRMKELAEKSKTRKTESDVMSARERYLARKKESENKKNGSGV